MAPKAKTSTNATVLGGYVTDEKTSRTIEGVKLTVMGIREQNIVCYTNKTGQFLFNNLPSSAGPRQVRLFAEKDGYETSITDPTLGATSHAVSLTPATPPEDDR
jgi:hypothetical protein